MSARAHILGKVRAALGREATDSRRAEVARALAHPPSHLRPHRGTLGAEVQTALFLEMAAAADAEVMRVADLHGVPQQVARFLAANHLGREVTAVPHPLVARVPWRLQSPVTVREVQALPDWRRAEDRPPWVASGAGTTLSVAWAAVAETGTVVMRSGREAPASLNFLGENHIVLVEQTVIVPNYEDVWMRLRRESGGDVGAFMPRAVHFITGPSRSADIEQTIQLGAHGPRRLFIVVIDDVGQG